jgi:16S rRNA (guanine527-N7)-methyltransferase
VSLVAYRDLLLKWNQRVNLTAASTAAEIDEHIADCLHLLPHLPTSGRVLDVGSGGGLPAVVIAIERPELAITALEPTHKKHAFLRTAARELHLANLDPRAERWEDHTDRDYAAAMSRAFIDLASWLHIGARFVAPGGVVLGMEGRDRLEPLPTRTTRHPYDSRSIISKII